MQTFKKSNLQVSSSQDLNNLFFINKEDGTTSTISIKSKTQKVSIAGNDITVGYEKFPDKGTVYYLNLNTVPKAALYYDGDETFVVLGVENLTTVDPGFPQAVFTPNSASLDQKPIPNTEVCGMAFNLGAEEKSLYIKLATDGNQLLIALQ